MTLDEPKVAQPATRLTISEIIKYTPWRGRVLTLDERVLRLKKIKIAIRYLLDHNGFDARASIGNQARLAEYFCLTRQRIGQIVKREREKIKANSESSIEAP